MTERNWAGNHEYAAERVVVARDVEHAQQVVRESDSVHALGTRHSFNDVADGRQTLLTMTAIAPEFALDETLSIATVGAGLSYGVVAAWLESRGVALHNMGSLPHISVAGAVATGTHGSGNALGILGGAVRGIQLIGPDGELDWIRSGDPDFDGAVVSLGALGVVARLELAVEPSYRVRQDAYRGLPWTTAIESIEEITAAGYSVSLLTDFATESIENVWIKTRLDGDDPGFMPTSLFGAERVGLDIVAEPADQSANMTTFGGVAGPWSERLPHFRLDSTPSVGDELQAEYFVRRSDAAAALTAVHALAAQIHPIVHAMELRTVAADSLWLSPMFERDALAFAFTWKNLPAEVGDFLPTLERALAPFDPRPHWGKLFDDSLDFLGSYPRLDDFRGLVARRDPHGKFAGPYLRRVLALP